MHRAAERGTCMQVLKDKCTDAGARAPMSKPHAVIAFSLLPRFAAH